MNKFKKGENLTIRLTGLLFFLYPLSSLIVKITSLNIIEPIVLILIFIGFRYNLIGRFIYYNKNIFALIFFFLIITIFSTILFNSSFKNIQFGIRLLVYFFVFCSIAGSAFKVKDILGFLRNFLLVFSIICFLSLLDYFKILQIPFFNETSLVFDDTSLAEVSDLPSIYGNRNQFAVFLLLGFVISYQFLIEKIGNLYINILSIFLISICLFLSFSRGAILSCLLFLIIKNINSFNFSTIIFFSIVLFFISKLEFLFPAYEILSTRFSSLSEGSLTQGDKWRYVSFYETLNELPTHPIGLGWGNFESKLLTGVRNSHNTFVTILRAGGFVGVCILLLTVVINKLKIITLFGNKNIIYLKNIVIILIFYSVTHDILGTLILYVSLGIIFSFRIKNKQIK